MDNTIEMRHGRLKLRLPRDWQDRSELAFESPTQRLAADPRRPGSAKEYSNNMHVTFEDRAPHLSTPSDYIDLIEEQLKKQGVIFREIRRFEVASADAPRLGVERRINTSGGWVRQLSVVAFYDDLTVVATGSTIEPTEEATLNELRELLGSVRLD